MSRVLETVLTGRNLLSPVLASAGRDVVAFNSTVAGANEKAAAGSAASARVQQASATTSAAASGKAASAATAGAGTQSAAADKIAASNVKASTSASASTQQQTRAHTQAAQSATLNARIQETANRSLAASNGLLGTSLTPLTAGLGGTALALGYAGYKGMEFDTSMSRVQAATQATSGDMERLRESAITMGADTQFSSVEAAAGITEMAKAGVSTTNIIGGGLKGALDLAAAGEMEVADAAEIGATALNVFNLRGNQMGHVADLLAAGAGKAQGSVHDLGMALNQSALVASATGLSIEETTGTLAAFASAGLIGSDAGTSFRSMLLHLQNPSKEAAGVMADLGVNMYDAQGQFVGMESLAGQLQTQMRGLTQAERDKSMATIFGSDAVRAANILYTQGARGIEQWTNKVNDAGYASRQAAQLNDNLRGDLERLGGAVDSFFTNLGDGAQGPLREAVQMLTLLVNAGGDVLGFFSSLPGPVQTALVAFLAFTALRGPLDSLFSMLSVKIMGAATGMGMAAANAGGFRGALGGLLGMINPVTLGLSLATAGLAQFASDSAAVDTRMRAAADAGDSFRSTLREQKGELSDATLAAADLAIEAAGLADAFDDLGISAATAIDAMNGDRGSYDEIIASLEEMDRKALLTEDSWTNLFGVGTRVSMDAVSGKATEMTDAFKELSGVIETSDGLRALFSVSSTGGFGAFIDAQNAATEATDAAKVETEEATAALEDWLEQLQKVGDGFVDPLATYKGLLEEKTAAEREAAEATAASTEDSSDSWKDYVTDVDVSLDELALRLEEQILAQENWRANIATVTQRGGLEVGQILAAMGVEGAGIVAKMAGANEEEFARMAAAMIEDARLGGAGAAAALDQEMKVMAEIGAAGAGATAIAIAQKLGLGLADVRNIAAQYGIELASGLDPLLTALGQRNIALRERGGGMDGRPRYYDGGYTGDGDKYDPAGIVHRGEYVLTKEQTARLGIDRIEEFANRGYANGGFVTAADVPRPSSTAPYGPPISTAGDATMRTAYDETVAWMKANTEALQGGSAGGGAVGGAWGSLWQLVKSQIPQARINSTFRAGDPGYHGRGKAIDFGFGSGPGGAGSAGLASINRLLHDQVGRNLAELIYDGSGDDRPDLRMGAPHTYSAATRAQHTNHVHAAVADTGGIAQTGTALLNLSGRPERMLDPRQTEAFERWMNSPAAMPGYGAGSVGGATIDYDRLAAAISRVAGQKTTHIAVDATGFNADLIARKVADTQRVEEFLSA